MENSKVQCIDCTDVTELVTYWGGGPRCKPCTARKNAEVYATRRAESDAAALRLKAHIEAGCPDDGEVCESCCEHERDPDEGMMCLNCNAEWDGP